MLFRRSYFAFSLASEHHRFYMKLRDSFISLKHISNELNIPLTVGRKEPTGSDIIPSDYESCVEKVAAPATSIDDANIKMIDKTTKVSGTRVRNLKKSMLNDNKLIKLRNRFLRRSKSTVGIACSTSSSFECQTKEEYQNKENEQPKSLELPQQIQVAQQPATSNTLMSPNRNRVKMGTRVFSPQFLNKSFDNVFDTTLESNSRSSDEANSRSFLMHPNGDSRGSCRSRWTKRFDSERSSCSAASGSKSGNEATPGDDALSLKSTSCSSLYFSEKLSEQISEPPFPSEAYVIREYRFSS